MQSIADDPKAAAILIARYIESVGVRPMSINLSISSGTLAAASGTVTCASVQAGDTVTINGVTVTAHASTTDASTFAIGASNTACGDNLVTCLGLSASALVAGIVSASNAAGVVTITALHKGVMGNCVTLASSNGTRLAVSGARLTSGAGGFGSTVKSYTLGV
jgi:phage tail sheath gpL-like